MSGHACTWRRSVMYTSSHTRLRVPFASVRHGNSGDSLRKISNESHRRGGRALAQMNEKRADAFFFPSLSYFPLLVLPGSFSRTRTVTSFVVAVLPRDVIFFGFNESATAAARREILSVGRAPGSRPAPASSADNLQKFPFLCVTASPFFSTRKILSIERKERGIIELASDRDVILQHRLQNIKIPPVDKE